MDKGPPGAGDDAVAAADAVGFAARQGMGGVAGLGLAHQTGRTGGHAQAAAGAGIGNGKEIHETPGRAGRAVFVAKTGKRLFFGLCIT